MTKYNTRYVDSQLQQGQRMALDKSNKSCVREERPGSWAKEKRENQSVVLTVARANMSNGRVQQGGFVEDKGNVMSKSDGSQLLQ
jgi:hypothetical protein